MENSARHTREEEMFTLIKTSMDSEISNKEFCKVHDLTPANFYYWKKKYLESAIKSEKFIPVKVQSPFAFTNEIEICYPNGVHIKLPQGTDLSMIRSFIGLF